MVDRSRAWSWTINNPTQSDRDDMFRLMNVARYFCYGEEIGEEKTLHWQGYVYFEHAKTLNGAKLALPRAHLEMSRGSPEQNREYCVKQCGEDNFVESGNYL